MEEIHAGDTVVIHAKDHDARVRVIEFFMMMGKVQVIVFHEALERETQMSLVNFMDWLNYPHTIVPKEKTDA